MGLGLFFVEKKIVDCHVLGLAVYMYMFSILYMYSILMSSNIYMYNNQWGDSPFSLRSKHFCGVWEQRKTEEWDFRCFYRAKNGARAKKRKRGLGELRGVEGNEGTACRQTPGFWKPPFASERSSRLAGIVEFYWHVSIEELKLLRCSRVVYKKLAA